MLVLGASGYVGGRLVPELVAAGCAVRCLSRSVDRFDGLEWADDVDVVEGDLLEPDDRLAAAFADVDQVVYLVHSLDTGSDFMEREAECARNAADAATEAGVGHIVYLGGLGDDRADLSDHLRSRHEVGRHLASSTAPVTELRAAIILGAGSASFEMLRNLTEVLPAMVVPKWVMTTRVQPIAIADVITYLLTAIDDPAPHGHRIMEIGGPEAMTYRELIDTYAEVAGLVQRVIVPVPVVTPRLSSHWVNLVTALPAALARSLVDSLQHDVVVTRPAPGSFAALRTLPADQAIDVALSEVDGLKIPTHWTGTTPRQRLGQEMPWDPEWSGRRRYEERHERIVDATPAAVRRTVTGIGGKRGWYGFGPLWAVRGLLDKAFGGVGLRRGRRHPDEIRVGEALDFWRVDESSASEFRLRAEMKLPGEAWLSWKISEADDHATRLVQTAHYVPRGLFGRAYWWSLFPVHKIIFPVMIRRIAAAAEAIDDEEPSALAHR